MVGVLFLMAVLSVVFITLYFTKNAAIQYTTYTDANHFTLSTAPNFSCTSATLRPGTQYGIFQPTASYDTLFYNNNAAQYSLSSFTMGILNPNQGLIAGTANGYRAYSTGSQTYLQTYNTTDSFQSPLTYTINVTAPNTDNVPLYLCWGNRP